MALLEIKEVFRHARPIGVRSYLSVIRRLKKLGYEVHFFFLWVPTVELALTRGKGRFCHEESTSSDQESRHIFEISAEFPNAVFLLEDYFMQASCSGKRVIHAGEIVQDIFDGKQQSEAHDWVLLDIFAPFVAEWNEGLPFATASSVNLSAEPVSYPQISQTRQKR